jgi:hypothetical protein
MSRIQIIIVIAIFEIEQKKNSDRITFLLNHDFLHGCKVLYFPRTSRVGHLRGNDLFFMVGKPGHYKLIHYVKPSTQSATIQQFTIQEHTHHTMESSEYLENHATRNGLWMGLALCLPKRNSTLGTVHMDTCLSLSYCSHALVHPDSPKQCI